VRHAYDKPNGAPTIVYLFSDSSGLMLGNDSFGYLDTRGFNQNHKEFLALLRKYST